MGNRPWYPWYPGDYMTSIAVQTMTLEEEGAYRRLLDLCWLNTDKPGYLPNDIKTMSKLLQIRPQTMRKLWENVRHRFVTTEENAWVFNPRLLSELEKTLKISQKRAKAGRSKCSANAQQLQTHSHSQPHSQSHSQKKKSSRKEKSAAAADLSELAIELKENGVFQRKAVDLASTQPERCQRALNLLPHRKVDNPGAWLASVIESADEIPDPPSEAVGDYSRGVELPEYQDDADASGVVGVVRRTDLNTFESWWLELKTGEPISDEEYEERRVTVNA